MRNTISLRAFNDLFPDETAAREWFERARWPHGPECYHCGVIGVAAYMPKTKFWHCKACKKQFSVTANTLMHRTHLPLLTWAHAIYLVVASSKGISSLKLAEMLGLGNATAWFLGQRIRTMMAEQNPILAGVAELTGETFTMRIEDIAAAPLYEMSIPQKKAEAYIGGLEKPINEHLIKLATIVQPRSDLHWQQEIENWLGDISTITLKPGGRPVKANFYYRILFDEPFGGTEARNVAFIVSRLARRKNEIDPKFQPERVAERLMTFHKTFATRASTGTLMDSEIEVLVAHFGGLE